MTLQEHYYAIKSGKGNKGQFLKQARSLFPEYFNQYTDFDTATNVLKSKQIISEAAGGVVAKGFDIFDWKKILAEEVNIKDLKPNQVYGYDGLITIGPNKGGTIKGNCTYLATNYGSENNENFKFKWITIISQNTKYPVIKGDIFFTNDEGLKNLTFISNLNEEVKAEEKETSKEVLDKQSHAYDNSDTKNADNVNFNEIMKGFYAEMRDEKNAGKTGDEIKAMVVKNLAKDPLFYTKDGMFGTKGVGYTNEAPALGVPKEAKGKHKSSGYGDLKENKETPNEKIERYESYTYTLDGKEVTPEIAFYDNLLKAELDGELYRIGEPVDGKIELNPIKGKTGIYTESVKENEVDEAMDQGPVSIKGKTGPSGGQQKAPRALFLDKEIIGAINNAKPGSIKILTKGDGKSYMYVSDFVKNALDELERGRTSREKSKKQSVLADILSEKLPAAVRGKIKKEINPKMDQGLKMHYVNLNMSPKKDKTGYWILMQGEFEPLVTEEQKLRSIIREIIKESLEVETNLNEISPELFKRATDVSRERGQDRRTSSMGETFFNKFKGKPLMGSTIADVSYAKPQSGDYEEVIVRIEVPSSVVPGETKSRYIYYDVRKDQWGVDKEITRADARVLSLIAQHINPNTRYKSGGEGFQIKGY